MFDSLSSRYFFGKTAECAALLQQNLKVAFEHFPEVLKRNLFEGLKKRVVK